jgi:aryl sulfotransferase
MTESVRWPRKTHELHSHHFDSTIWNDFKFRDDDIIIATYANMKRDLPGQMRRMAAFLDIPIDESKWNTIVEYCSFDWMKQHATKSVPLGGAFWDAGAQVFINQGKNGRWTDALTADDRAEYEVLAVRNFGPVCARWLATGA